MSDPMIIFENVTKKYPLYHHIVGGFKQLLFNPLVAIERFQNSHHNVLEEITLKVPRGEILGIVGKNGAGKSTLLGLILGVLRPTKGRVLVRGKALALLELSAGFHPDLSGRENILLKGVLLGRTRREVKSRVQAIINFADIGKFIDEPVRIYSQGMTARLGFAVIVCLDPEVLLIDDVLAVGDSDFKKKCTNQINLLRSAGTTVVMASHLLDELLRKC